jgi:hypothetical protein
VWVIFDDTIIVKGGQFTLEAWHETTTIYIHTHPLTTTHGESYNKTSRLGQEMEDTRREREVAQGLGIIVQHIISISLDPDNADMLPRRCRLRVAPRGATGDSE